jgi:hypothetical protein
MGHEALPVCEGIAYEHATYKKDAAHAAAGAGGFVQSLNFAAEMIGLNGAK